MSACDQQNLLYKDAKLTLMKVPKELHFAPLPLDYQVRIDLRID